MGCFMGGEGTVKIDWSRYNSILCKLGFDGSFRELICSHGFEPTFECESLGVGIAQPLDESGEVSDPLVFINLIDSGGSWKGTYSELANRLGVGVAE